MSTASNPAYQLPSTSSEVEERVLQLVNKNDIEGGKALLVALREEALTRGSNDKVDAFIHALMFNDHGPMARGCLSSEDIARWITRTDVTKPYESVDYQPNWHHFLYNCPQLMVDGLNALRVDLASLFQMFTVEQKEEAMAGQSSVAALRYMVSALGVAPRLWTYLDWTWLGEEGSPTRSKAMALGWSTDMLPSMMKMHVGKEFSSSEPTFIRTWSHLVPYPYSLYLLSAVLNNTAGQSEKERMFRYKACDHVLGQISKDPNANPIDVETTRILVTRALTRGDTGTIHTYSPHPDVARLSDKEMNSLLGLVTTHIALGILPELQKLVLSGGLESMQSMRTDESFEIPSSVGP